MAKGVPSSWAAAATTPPRSVSFCSRARAICVAASASDIAWTSAVTREANMPRKMTPITMAVQNPYTKSCGIRMMAPCSVRRGTCQRATTLTSAMVAAPRNAVVRGFKAVAEIVTGARMRSANGLFRPPVRARRNASCDTSKRSIKATSTSVSRLFSGKTKTAKRFATMDAPMARKHRPRLRSRSKRRWATVMAASWPPIATHLSTMRVLRRTQFERWIVVSKVCCSTITSSYVRCAVLL